LTLLVTRIGADHPHHSITLDDLALAADLLDASQYLHCFPLRALGTPSTMFIAISPVGHFALKTMRARDRS
jgi:hypothetical protein